MISLSLESEGLELIQKKLDELRATLGSSFSGIELKGKTREDGINNANILQWQAEIGRDAVTTTSSENDEIASSFTAELDKALASKVAKKGAVVAAKALKAAMRSYMEAVTKHIEDESGANGPFKPLNEDYAKQKLADIGFDDMLKYTGQLLDNLNPDGTAARNVRLLK